MGTNDVKQPPPLRIKVKAEDFNRDNEQRRDPVRVRDDGDGVVTHLDSFQLADSKTRAEPPDEALRKMCERRIPHETGLTITPGARRAIWDSGHSYSTMGDAREGRAISKLVLTNNESREEIILSSGGGYIAEERGCHFNTESGIAVDVGPGPGTLLLSYTDADGAHQDIFDLATYEIKKPPDQAP